MSSAGKTIRQNNAAEVLIGLAVVVLAVLFLAFLYMRTGSGSASDINKGTEIPADSSLQVTSSGILGGQYISIQPGGDDKLLAAGGMIENAQGSADLMSMIGHFALGGNGSSTPAPAPAPATPAPATPPATLKPQALPDGP